MDVFLNKLNGVDIRLDVARCRILNTNKIDQITLKSLFIVNLFYYKHNNFAAGNILSFVKIIPRCTPQLSGILDQVF